MPRITKSELLAKIDRLESELGLASTTIAQLQREVDAQMVAQRPSRAAAQPKFVDTVAVARPMPFSERCARAREIAMKTGRCVQVVH